MPAPGLRVGRYELMSLLGSGGMGEVFRALDAQLGRHVAVKFLSAIADPSRAGASSRKRRWPRRSIIRIS